MSNIPNRTPSTTEAIVDKFLALPTWGLLLISGVLLGLAFPPNVVGGLFAALGLVPLIVALERSDNWRRDVIWSYVAFLYFSGLSTWWVGSWQTNSDPWLATSSILLVIIHPLFFSVPIALYGVVRRMTGLRTGLTFLVFLWTGGEYLHALGEASYPWLTLGNSQTYNLLYIQFIEWTGVWGLTLLLLVQNALIAWFLLHRKTSDFRPATERRDTRLAGTALLLTVILPYSVGLVLTPDLGTEPNGAITVTIVQPNQNPWDKWNQQDTVDHILDNGSLTLDAIAAGAKPDMILWAENAVPYLLTNPSPTWANKANLMRSMMKMIDVPVVTGFPDWVVHPSEEEATPSSKRDSIIDPETGGKVARFYDHYNSIGVFDVDGTIRDIYHKSRLVPFGERIPYIDAAPFLADMLAWDVGISTWGQGRGPHALTLPGDRPIRFAGMVCFESVYPNLVREFVADGSEFLTIVTNDGWYLGTPGPLQHQRFAILRAIETRRGIARAANTGISCFIDPDGMIHDETEEGARTTVTASIPLMKEQTLYTRWGDWLPIGSLIGAAATLLIGLLRKRALTASHP